MNAEQAFDAVFFETSNSEIRKLTPTSRFAHYTSADTAMRILRGENGERSLWLRRASEMNDFSEIEHGHTCLERTLGSENGKRLRNLVNVLFPTAFDRADEFRSAIGDYLREDTYLTSFAHHDGEQLDHGLLSMWRAYGGEQNVCILFHTEPFFGLSKRNDIVLSPVFYGGEKEITEVFGQIADRFETHAEAIRPLGFSRFVFNLINVLKYAAQATKHAGFKEEREWRLIYDNEYAGGSFLPRSIRSIGGVVQTVFHKPLTPAEAEGDVSFAPADIIDKIIIGPTSSPSIVRSAFEELLREANIQDPRGRVMVSGIPLRR